MQANVLFSVLVMYDRTVTVPGDDRLRSAI